MRREQFTTGMYIVDSEYRIVSRNDFMAQLYPAVKVGDVCYKAVALRDSPCEVCPLEMDNALFYNPVRKEWIYANAAEMEYPGCGRCYNVQFQLRQRLEDVGRESLQQENMDEYIAALNGGNPDISAIGGYCAVGSPLSYANPQLLKLLGYDDLEQFRRDIDGLVSNTIHPDDVERVTRDLTRCAQQGGSFETTYRIRRRDQSWFWIVSRGMRVMTKSGEFVLLCAVYEMNAYLQSQEALRSQNQELLRRQLTSEAVLEHMPGGYHRCADAPGWPFLYFGASFEKITGWSRREIEEDFGNQFINMVLPEDIPLCAGIVEAIEEEGYSNNIYRLKKKGGGHIWVSDSTMKVVIGEEVFYQGVLADVSAQIRELEQARQAAEASNLAKSTFLFNASHDIRTPMNAIQGFSHIIAQNAHDPQRVLEAVGKLQRSGDVLLTLMNDILELSRIERGKESVENRPLDMLAHTDKLREMMLPEMTASGLAFRMENQIIHPLVLADDLKLTRIAMNLLSNAKKFTPEGGSVTFGVIESDYDGVSATYSLFVQDTGIGMSEEFQKRAFDQFERERTPTVSGVSGSGLGLAIIQKLSGLMGGSCAIESQLGKGSRLTCSIPLTLAAPEDFPQELRLDKVSFSGKRILLVEDNDFNREIGKYVFEDIGFAVAEAENGAVCLEMLTHHPAGTFDFILMDVQMPVMDGYAATKAIRALADPALASIPIIAMTANAFEEDRRRCLEVGMDGHIGKPLNTKAVLAEFLRVLPGEEGCL